MITYNGHDLTARRMGNLVAAAIYRGARLVWTAIASLSAWFRSEGYFRSEAW